MFTRPTERKSHTYPHYSTEDLIGALFDFGDRTTSNSHLKQVIIGLPSDCPPPAFSAPF